MGIDVDEKKEKIILIGASCSGKDYLSKGLVLKGLKKSVSYTTRPKRKGEVDGVDYNFISIDRFKSMIDNNEFYEYEEFKENWFYGSSKQDWENCNLFIKTKKGIDNILKEDRKDCFIVYLNIDEKVRIERLLERNDDNDSVSRRILADAKDLEGFCDYDLKINSEDFDIDMVYDLME